MARKRKLLLEIDAYDSSFFKKKIARLNILCTAASIGFSIQLKDLTARAIEEKVMFLIIKLDKPIASYERPMRALNFESYGESLDFKLRLEKYHKRPACDGIKIRLLKKKEKHSAIGIGRDAFRMSYFYAASIASRKRIDDYHARWVENLIRDKDTKVFAAIKNGNVVGFNAISLNKQKKHARIILIAVDKKHRGINIGRRLVQESIHSLGDRYNDIFVKTQRQNKKAIALYKAVGFKLKSKDRIFCKKL